VRLRRNSPRHAGRAFLVPGTARPASIPASTPGPDVLVPPELGRGVVLRLGGAREDDTSRGVGGLDEARAVEAHTGRLTAPAIRGADLGEDPVERDRAGGAGGHGLGFGLSGVLGEVEDFGDVALRVVVGAMPMSA
jgi:hypothetical protein